MTTSGDPVATQAFPKKPPYLRLTIVAAIVLGVGGSFLFLGGWLTPNDITPAKFADAFEKVDGVHSGFRRNHAKGVGVAGYFESNGNGSALSKAVIFQQARVSVIGRFSLSGGNPMGADAANPVRGLGLLFSLPDGGEWRMAMINLPVFPVNTPQGFYDRTIASVPDPVTGKADPEKMKAFLAVHPETVAAVKIIKSHPVASGFENTAFNSLNAFVFLSAAGVSTPVRWSMAPEEPQVDSPDGKGATTRDDNYLFERLIEKLHHGPLRWHLMITIGQPGDPTNDATLPWSDGRTTLEVGTLTIDHIESEETSPARDVNFDPLVLPSGILPSDDPLLSARSAVYSQSFTRRAGETKQPSAITPADVQKGG